MRSVVLLSGGLDSLVCLAREVGRGNDPHCLWVGYGQSHASREGAAARAVAAHYGVPLAERAAAGCFGPSALTGGGPVPRGYPADDPAQADTVVRGRNLVLLALGVAHAAAVGAGKVVFGGHLGDAAVYPDCRPEFVAAASRAAELSVGVYIDQPFAGVPKKDVVRAGRELAAPLRLAWSCYAGGALPCGGCGACVARSAAERGE